MNKTQSSAGGVQGSENQDQQSTHQQQKRTQGYRRVYRGGFVRSGRGNRGGKRGESGGGRGGSHYASHDKQNIQDENQSPTPKQQQESDPAQKLESVPAPRQESQPSPKQETQPAPKQETQPAPKVESQPAPRQESQPAARQETQPAPKVESQPAPKEESKPASRWAALDEPEKPIYNGYGRGYTGGSSYQSSRWASLDQPEQRQYSGRIGDYRGSFQQSSRSSQPDQHHYNGKGEYHRGQTGSHGATPTSYGQAASWQQYPPNANIEAELFAGSNSGINFDKYEEIPVEATGDQCPDPIDNFDGLDLHDWVRENIKKTGYNRPTPVQKYSIPTLNSRRDLMSCAQTGSGKTAAFLVPIINQILKGGSSAVRRAEVKSSGISCHFPLALVISPTRELALQIYNECRKFSYRTPITSAVLYGGRENYRDQIYKIRLGVNILIATPGRLIDVISQGYVALDECRFLVLDEADRMLDMGFEPQIRQIVLLNGMPPRGDRVTAMFSATFPKEIQLLAQDFLIPDYIFLAVGRVGSTSENITQSIAWVEESNKRHVLRDVLDQNEPGALTLIFVETKRGVDELERYLRRDGYNAVAIHGDLKQIERERHLGAFRSSACTILVATAVAARGLDIPNVKYVINFDLPNDIDEYVHRIGRTARAGNTGFAMSFLNNRNRNIARELAELLIEANQELPEWFEKFVNEIQRYGYRGRGGNANRFGGRDHRIESAPQRYTDPSYTFNDPPPLPMQPLPRAPLNGKNWWE